MLDDLKHRSKILKDLVGATRHEDVSMIIPDEFHGAPEIVIEQSVSFVVDINIFAFSNIEDHF